MKEDCRLPLNMYFSLPNEARFGAAHTMLYAYSEEDRIGPSAKKLKRLFGVDDRLAFDALPTSGRVYGSK